MPGMTRLRSCLAAVVFTVPSACTTIGVSVPQSDAGDPQAAWARVLAHHVDPEGRIDFTGLADDRGDLGTFIAYIAHTPPDAFAERQAKLAYLINSYNALSMASVLDLGIPERLDLLDRIQFFVVRRAVVGGQAISLRAYENEVIRPLGDERVHFALNCMVASCPRLPQHPFTANGLDHELDAAARLFFTEPRNCAVDPTKRELHLSEILSFYTEDFLAKAPSLPAYATAGARTRCPRTLRSRFIHMTGQSTGRGEHHHEARRRLIAFPFRWRLDRRDPQRKPVIAVAKARLAQPMLTTVIGPLLSSRTFWTGL